MTKKKKTAIIILCIILAIILTLVSTFFILTYIGKRQFHKDDTNISAGSVTTEDDTTITYNSKKYTLNKNIVSVLVMGIDRDNINKNLGNGNNGQADVIFVATIDTKTKETCIIPISRETMTDVDIYTENGEFAQTEKEQLCLAYAYGNTADECSKNTLKSVRRLLCGININSYVTIEMKGISTLTTMLGGIEVTALEDVPSNVATITKNKNVLLKGNSALDYIRHRDDDIEANNRRMQRQKQFLSALLSKTGNEVINDFSNLTKYFNALSPYFSTNVSFPQITYLASHCLSMNFGDTLNYKTIEGTLTQGDTWVEFNADEQSILKTVIEVFYVENE